MNQFLGFSYSAWGFICLVVAGVSMLLWPRAKVTGPEAGYAYYILRWGHSLVWLLLAVSLFFRGRAPGAANWLALGALAVYLVFIGTLFKK